MKMFKFDNVNKCNGCLWETDKVFVLADTKEEAKKLLENGEAGLCGECIGKMLSECEYSIKNKQQIENLKNYLKDLYLSKRIDDDIYKNLIECI